MAMLRVAPGRLGLPGELPGTGAIAKALIEAGAPVDGHPGEPETLLITAASSRPPRRGISTAGPLPGSRWGDGSRRLGLPPAPRGFRSSPRVPRAPPPATQPPPSG